MFSSLNENEREAGVERSPMLVSKSQPRTESGRRWHSSSYREQRQAPKRQNKPVSRRSHPSNTANFRPTIDSCRVPQKLRLCTLQAAYLYNNNHTQWRKSVCTRAVASSSQTPLKSANTTRGRPSSTRGRKVSYRLATRRIFLGNTGDTEANCVQRMEVLQASRSHI